MGRGKWQAQSVKENGRVGRDVPSDAYMRAPRPLRNSDSPRHSYRIRLCDRCGDIRTLLRDAVGTFGDCRTAEKLIQRHSVCSWSLPFLQSLRVRRTPPAFQVFPLSKANLPILLEITDIAPASTNFDSSAEVSNSLDLITKQRRPWTAIPHTSAT